MKPIEERAREYSDAEYPKCGLYDSWADDGFDEGYNAAMNSKADRAFIDGANYERKELMRRDNSEEMPMTYTRRRNIERATLFKVQYVSCARGLDLLERKFRSQKIMSQWIARNDKLFAIFIVKMLALIDDIWDPFTTIGKKSITLSDLEFIEKNLREEYKPSKD